MADLTDLASEVLRALAALDAARDLPAGILLAVSGGPDSLALLLAASTLRDGRMVRAATVDHALRPAAADEARHVAARARELGVPHATLVWRHGQIHGNLQGAAREARYRLLAAHARRIGAGAVLTAHHRADQIETHLLLEARGARGAALAGMRVWRDLEPRVALVRPFLAREPEQLAAAVRAAGWRAVDDPSNHDPRFARIRLRRSLDRSRDDPLADRIGVAARLRAEDDARLAAQLQSVWASGGEPIGKGDGDLPSGGLLVPTVAADLTDRSLSRLVTAAGGGLTPPAAVAVARLRERLREVRRSTLGNCLIARRSDGLLLTREPGRSRCPRAAAGEDGTAWLDRRFWVAGLRPGEEVWGEGTGLAPKRERRPDRLGDPAPGESAAEPSDVPIASVSFVRAPLDALAAFETVSWRLWADLPGAPPAVLTARPQIAAKAGSPVGKV